MAITSIFAIFQGLQLTSVPGLSILRTDPYRPAKRIVSFAKLAESDQSKVSDDRYREKIITIRIAVQRNTRAEVEQSLDSLYANLRTAEGELVLAQSIAANGTPGVRRYTATYKDFNLIADGGSYVEMDLIFECSDPFGYDTGYTTLHSTTGNTGRTLSSSLLIRGSAPWQVPTIEIYYTALTGGTDKTVTIGNTFTGQQVFIRRNWQPGDRIEIDTRTESVKVNGIKVDYTGAVPKFAPGFAFWNYTDNFTSGTYNARIIIYPRWI